MISMNKSYIKKKQNSTFDPHQFERPGLSTSDIGDIKQIFDIFDHAQTGVVSIKEMIASLDSLGEEPQKQTLYVMLKQNAENGQSHLDFYEFLEVMSNRISSKDNRTDLKKVFAMLDEDNRGFISIDTLKKVAKDLGDNIDECQLKEMIEAADLDKDGLVSVDDFYLLMTTKTSKHTDKMH